MKKLFMMMAALVLVLAAVSCNAQKETTQSEATQIDLSGKWDVVNILDTVVPDSLMSQPMMEFDTVNSSFHGNAGVNIVNGNYTQENEKMTFGKDCQTTMMMGDSVSVAIEKLYMEAMEQVKTVSSDEEGTLNFNDKDGKTVMVLKKN